MKLRKIVSAVLSLSMLMGMAVMPVNAAESDSAKMRTALEAVRSKVDVPKELKEFKSNSRTYEDETTYSFSWSDEEGDNSLHVDCDDEGRISYYGLYKRGIYDGSQKLPGVSKADAQREAENFLKKIAPETMSDANDMLKAADTRSMGSSGYNVGFVRKRNGANVKNNTANVSIELTDGKAEITNVNINYDYDAEFETDKEKISNPEELYKENFGAELVYEKFYDTPKDENDIKLVYRLKDSTAGYISSYTGEVVEETVDAEMYRYSVSGGDAEAEDAGASNASMKSVELTKEELAELDKISELYSAEEAVKFLKSIPALKISSDYKVTDTNAGTVSGVKNEKKTYFLQLSLLKEKTGDVYARFDAERKRLTSFNHWWEYNEKYKEDKELSDREKGKADSETADFLKRVFPTADTEFTETDSDYYGANARKYYTRVTKDDIPYVNNTISVTYDTNEKAISSYYLRYDDDAEFVSPENAVDADKAYEYMLELKPLEEIYVFSDGEYKRTYTMPGTPEIDAFTGEDMYKENNYSEKKEYTDIANHWCNEAVTALSEYGIALAGDEFMPDTEIRQADLMRLLLSGMNYKYYITSNDDAVYDCCYDLGVIEKTERNDDAKISREMAFVYMIRFAGYEEVAKLSDIYKVSYSDGDKLTSGLIGYAAILSGMGIIAGDGGNIRPKDSLTRAEAAVMLYRYMK